MVEGFLSIVAHTAPDAVERLRVFLVNTVGWSVAQDVTDTALERDVVFSSPGEVGSDNGNTRYIRLRALSGEIQLFTYETFVSVAENTGEVTDASFGKLAVGEDARGYHLTAVADLERLVLHIEAYDATRYMAYVGRINTYYTVAECGYPNLVKGGAAAAYDWYYSAAERNSWMMGADSTVRHYYAFDMLDATVLAAGQSSDRNGAQVFSAPILVHTGGAGNSELAGEPRGVFRAPRELAAQNAFFPVGGRLYTVLESNGVPMLVGPVTASGTDVPLLYSAD